MEAYIAKRRKKSSKNKMLIVIIFIFIIASGIILYKFYEKIDINEANQPPEAVKTLRTMEEEKKENKEAVDVIEKATSNVVGISKVKNVGSSIFLKDSTSKLGLGTGVVVTDNGYILTNAHVSGEKYSTCYVTLESGETFTGNVVWSDVNIDLSILKISCKNMKYAVLGDSDNIRVGEKVYAIGNPIGFEFERTVTSGIISAVNRTIKIEEDEDVSYMSNLIQTDATINLGNSGGPLINIDGEVIGINTIKISSAEGIGFAVPINVVKPIIESFIQTGTFEQATLGIYAYDKEVIPYLNSNLNSNLNFNKGIYIAQINKNGPASKTEIKEGDIITTIDGNEINTMNELREYIYGKKPNDIVNIQIVRGKINKTISVVLRQKIRKVTNWDGSN